MSGPPLFSNAGGPRSPAEWAWGVFPEDDAAVRLLEAFPGAAAGYSMRLLRAGHAGACLRLRRSSDNDESDFGFGADGWLDAAAVVLWLGGATGYVTTFYDQSGNGRNLIQATAANQPPLLPSSALVNNHPAIDANFGTGAARYLSATFSRFQPLTVANVGYFTSHHPAVPIRIHSSNQLHAAADDFGVYGMSAGTYLTDAPSFRDLFAQLSQVYNGASSILRANGAQVATGNAGTNNSPSLMLGFNSGSANGHVIGEHVEWSSSSIDITGIDAAQKAAWGTP